LAKTLELNQIRDLWSQTSIPPVLPSVPTQIPPIKSKTGTTIAEEESLEVPLLERTFARKKLQEILVPNDRMSVNSVKKLVEDLETNELRSLILRMRSK
jgi:hypothetical protein